MGQLPIWVPGGRTQPASARRQRTKHPRQTIWVSVANTLEHLIAQADPHKAKALLRILIAGLRVNGKADIQPTYRIVAPPRTGGVCATSQKVETVGIEPTSATA
jgi:hypothetical protein